MAGKYLIQDSRNTGIVAHIDAGETATEPNRAFAHFVRRYYD